MIELDFQKDAEFFEQEHDFSDNPQNGGPEGSGRGRRVAKIKMAMEFGAAKAIGESAKLIREAADTIHVERKQNARPH